MADETFDLQTKTNINKNNEPEIKIWCDDHETILMMIYRASDNYTTYFHQAYVRYRKKLHNYRIPIIIISSFSGFLSISNISFVPLIYNKWVSLIVGFINLMVTVISLIENFKKIDSTMNKSYTSYFAFKTLSDEIYVILQTPQNERKFDGITTINRYFSKYQTIYLNIPLLNKKDVKNFEYYRNLNNNNCNSSDINSDNSTFDFKSIQNKLNSMSSDSLMATSEYFSPKKKSIYNENDNESNLLHNKVKNDNTLFNSKQNSVIKLNNLNKQNSNIQLNKLSDNKFTDNKFTDNKFTDNKFTNNKFPDNNTQQNNNDGYDNYTNLSNNTNNNIFINQPKYDEITHSSIKYSNPIKSNNSDDVYNKNNVIQLDNPIKIINPIKLNNDDEISNLSISSQYTNLSHSNDGILIQQDIKQSDTKQSEIKQNEEKPFEIEETNIKQQDVNVIQIEKAIIPEIKKVGRKKKNKDNEDI
jgi:hypothetical protein